MVDTSNIAEPSSPRRRWFQFRLRTLLIGVVLLAIPCAYIGHEARTVAARKEWLAHHPQPDLEVLGPLIVSPPDPAHPAEPIWPTLPLVRRLLGDQWKYRSSGFSVGEWEFVGCRESPQLARGRT